MVAAASHSAGSAPPSDVQQALADRRSFYLNRAVMHPEALSGIWVASNGRGGAVGIHLQLHTTLPSEASPLMWVPQAWQYLEVSVFERKGPEADFGVMNGFSDSVYGGGVRLENNRLRLHFIPMVRGVSGIDLNLLLRSDGCWHGRLHRGEYDSSVALCRPNAGRKVVRSRVVGTWSGSPGSGYPCIHIAQTDADRLTGWSDSLMVPGTRRFSREVVDHTLNEYYGALAKVDTERDGKVSVKFGAYSAMCCSHLFVGELSADGATLKGEFAAGPGQFARSAILTRMPGDSCVDAAAFKR